MGICREAWFSAYPRSFDLNYPIFPDSCRFLQFAGGKDVLEVLIDGSQVYGKEFCHLFLGQPKGLTLEQNLDAHSPVWRGIQDDLMVQWSLFVSCHFAPPLHHSNLQETGGNPASKVASILLQMAHVPFAESAVRFARSICLFPPLPAIGESGSSPTTRGVETEASPASARRF
jgi:hypothetical protein